MKASYAAAADGNLVLPLVDKVYGANFTHRCDYAVAFYRECAVNMAEVAPERTGMPAHCMQNAWSMCMKPLMEN